MRIILNGNVNLFFKQKKFFFFNLKGQISTILMDLVDSISNFKNSYGYGFLDSVINFDQFLKKINLITTHPTIGFLEFLNSGCIDVTNINYFSTKKNILENKLLNFVYSIKFFVNFNNFILKKDLLFNELFFGVSLVDKNLEKFIWGNFKDTFDPIFEVVNLEEIEIVNKIDDDLIINKNGNFSNFTKSKFWVKNFFFYDTNLLDFYNIDMLKENMNWTFGYLDFFSEYFKFDQMNQIGLLKVGFENGIKVYTNFYNSLLMGLTLTPFFFLSIFDGNWSSISYSSNGFQFSLLNTTFDSSVKIFKYFNSELKYIYSDTEFFILLPNALFEDQTELNVLKTNIKNDSLSRLIPIEWEGIYSKLGKFIYEPCIVYQKQKEIPYKNNLTVFYSIEKLNLKIDDNMLVKKSIGFFYSSHISIQNFIFINFITNMNKLLIFMNYYSTLVTYDFLILFSYVSIIINLEGLSFDIFNIEFLKGIFFGFSVLDIIIGGSNNLVFFIVSKFFLFLKNSSFELIYWLNNGCNYLVFLLPRVGQSFCDYGVGGPGTGGLPMVFFGEKTPQWRELELGEYMPYHIIDCSPLLKINEQDGDYYIVYFLVKSFYFKIFDFYEIYINKLNEFFFLSEYNSIFSYLLYEMFYFDVIKDFIITQLKFISDEILNLINFSFIFSVKTVFYDTCLIFYFYFVSNILDKMSGFLNLNFFNFFRFFFIFINFQVSVKFTGHFLFFFCTKILIDLFNYIQNQVFNFYNSYFFFNQDEFIQGKLFIQKID